RGSLRLARDLSLAPLGFPPAPIDRRLCRIIKRRFFRALDALSVLPSAFPGRSIAMNTLLTVGSAVFFAFSAAETIYREMSVQTLEAISEQRYDIRPILGPITSGGEARALDPPSDSE